MVDCSWFVKGTLCSNWHLVWFGSSVSEHKTAAARTNPWFLHQMYFLCLCLYLYLYLYRRQQRSLIKWAHQSVMWMCQISQADFHLQSLKSWWQKKNKLKNHEHKQKALGHMGTTWNIKHWKHTWEQKKAQKHRGTIECQEIKTLKDPMGYKSK